jgi:hypothetical protein
VIWPKPTAVFAERWGEDMKLTQMQFAAAGVEVEELEE